MRIIPLLLVFTSQTAVSQMAIPTRITNVSDAYPVESPDGKRIVFQSNRTGNWDIYTMNVDGSELKQLTGDLAPDNTPSWSPDGAKIVFVSERHGSEYDSEVYIMNADGSSQRRLTEQKGDDSHPKFSPDGKSIIFNSARSTPDLKVEWSKQWIELYMMDTSGMNVKRITSFKTVSTFASISPDGQKIVYRKVIDSPAFNWDLSNNKNGRNSEVFVMDIDGKNDFNLSNSAAYDGWPMWSGDSRSVVFSSNRAGPANVGQLYTVNVDGSKLRQLTSGPGGFVQPSWSSDNKRIYAYQVWEESNNEYGNIALFDGLL
jgi:TolB protein